MWLKEGWVCCQAGSALLGGLPGRWVAEGDAPGCLVGVRVLAVEPQLSTGRHPLPFTPHGHLDSGAFVWKTRAEGVPQQAAIWWSPWQGTTSSLKPSPVVCLLSHHTDSITTLTLKSSPQVPPCLLAVGNQIPLPSARLPAFSFLRKEPGRGWSFSLCSSDSIFSCSPTDCFAPLPYHPIPP